jgi:methyl-accepting chemotaxis protein
MQDLIKQLLEKTKLLAERYQQQVKKNNQLEIELAEIRNKLEQQNEIIKDLEERNKILKLAASLSGNTEENVSSIKLKINQLVKEIDKCVALLNK